MAQEEAFRRRKLNFNEEETEVLIREVTLNQEQLFGRGVAKIPPGAKTKIWLSILAKVNAVSKCTRDIGDIKKRWYDMCHRTKDKVVRLAQEAMQSERIAQTLQQENAIQSIANYDPAPLSTSNDSEPSTSRSSRDGHASRDRGSQQKKPALPSKMTWQAKQVPVQPLPDHPVQWPPVLLFTMDQNAAEESNQEPQGHQANVDFHETIVDVKQEDISSSVDVDYSSPEIGSPVVSREESPFQLGKRGRKQISEEELLGIQEQHNLLLGVGNDELHGIRQELRELRNDIQELTTTIRQPLERLADYVQALLPLLQHPPRPHVTETTDAFTQHDNKESSEFHSRGCRTGRKARKRAKVNVQ
ncbi:myb-related transcription factor, partner of profilin-like [Hypanus sabinus]|uniref:myb-related transcription factor, partner of profilin-like n=1 Tax=Hypanus sabinus TaxID=79690 RepID=UPI0028C3DA86|nr:myb-related transcription factor, partner of profilin-like [Hypanus sabinus]